MQVHLEYMGEDKEVPGSKMFKVEAIHVTTTRNRRKFTKEELEIAARSLSFRPLNINHEVTRALPFNQNGFLLNTTLDMHFNPEKNVVEGRIRVSDIDTIHRIESKDIDAVSIEQMPTRGETCDIVSCEQHGVAFIGLALLEKGIMPGDPNAKILTESFTTNTISDLTVPDVQRECEACTDFTKCHKCEHKMKAEDCMADKIREVKAAHPDWEQKRILAVALSKCGKSKDEQIVLYEKFKGYLQ